MSDASSTGRPPDCEPTGNGLSLDRAQRRQVAWISLGALALFFAARWLPTGTNLSHMYFRVDAKGASAIEFCDPLNPQFIPVVAARSPVTMTVTPRQPLSAGREAECTVMFRTASGKIVAPEDLLVSHTQKLHLLIVDPSLTDYQHVHPQPSRAVPGEWGFAFTPRLGGAYRLFADFTPAATARGLYASADLEVTGPVVAVPGPTTEGAGSSGTGAKSIDAIERDGFRFGLVASPQPMRAGKAIDLKFSVVAPAGGVVPLEPVMGAFAHLVAFDPARSGFAHLHPVEADLSKRPDTARPVLTFKLTIPRAGRYVIWAQVNLGGREVFVPFWFDVE